MSQFKFNDGVSVYEAGEDHIDRIIYEVFCFINRNIFTNEDQAWDAVAEFLFAVCNPDGELRFRTAYWGDKMGEVNRLWEAFETIIELSDNPEGIRAEVEAAAESILIRETGLACPKGYVPQERIDWIELEEGIEVDAAALEVLRRRIEKKNPNKIKRIVEKIRSRSLAETKTKYVTPPKRSAVR